MNSFAQPSRRIASNLLWTPQGVVRHPLLTLGADGRLLRVDNCADADRQPGTEFYAGLLVPGFPVDWRETFAQMLADARPLPEQLAQVVCPDNGVLVVLSGLDYGQLRLTPHSEIRKLF